MYQIQRNISINRTADKVWQLLSKPGHLELFHPFCKKNEPIVWKEDLPKKDILIYYNGLEFEGEFLSWIPKKEFELKIGKKDAKKSIVKWILNSNNKTTHLSIVVTPYTSSKIPRVLYPIMFYFIIKPKLKDYLDNVLMGCKYHLEENANIKFNQFGYNSWFTVK